MPDLFFDFLDQFWEETLALTKNVKVSQVIGINESDSEDDDVDDDEFTKSFMEDF